MKHRILILEDDPDMREALEYALSDFDCLFCSTLAQGFKEWTRGWDLIILDLSLPDGNGLELLQVVRLESDVPVLVFSGRKEESVILDAYAQKVMTTLQNQSDSRYLKQRYPGCLTGQKSDDLKGIVSRYRKTHSQVCVLYSSPEQKPQCWNRFSDLDITLSLQKESFGRSGPVQDMICL